MTAVPTLVAIAPVNGGLTLAKVGRRTLVHTHSEKQHSLMECSSKTVVIRNDLLGKRVFCARLSF